MSLYYKDKKNKKFLGLFLGPTIFVLILLIPTPYAISEFTKTGLISNSIYPQIALGTMLWMLVWWITECVPLGLTGLLAAIIFVILGILDVNKTLATFADPIIWIIISGYILAAAFTKSGLDKRITYSLAVLYKGNNPKIAVFFVACLPVFLLTVTGSITASTMIVFPFLISFMKVIDVPIANNHEQKSAERKKEIKDVREKADILYDKKPKSRYAEGSFLALGQSATAGALLLLVSTPANLIAKTNIENFSFPNTLSFSDWLIIGTPHAIIGLFLSWTLIYLLIKPEYNRLPDKREQMILSLKKMGKISPDEKIILVIMTVALLLWFVPSTLKDFYSNNEESGTFLYTLGFFISNISEVIPALFIIFSIGFISIFQRERMLNWDEISRSVDWNIIILFGGGLVLGIGIADSGLALMISSQIVNLIDITNEQVVFTIFLTSALLGFMLSYATSNTAAALIACPIAGTLSIASGINPIPPIIAAAISSSISSALPSTTPPMAIIYSSKSVRISSMLKTGLISDLIRLLIFIIIGPILIDIVF